MKVQSPSFLVFMGVLFGEGLCLLLDGVDAAAAQETTVETEIPEVEYDWMTSVYGDIEEMIPYDAPEPLGNYVLLTHYVDANLYHDMLTGRSVTGILHFLNATPIDWFSKRQATVQTATYGSEFVAARTCVEQVMDLRNTLRYLGVPILGKSYMFGDNESVANSSAKPHAKLHKRHTALSFHRVREAIAAGIVGFYHMPGPENPADILSKHWGYQQIWAQLKSLMFFAGDVANMGEVEFEGEEEEEEDLEEDGKEGTTPSAKEGSDRK